LNHERFLLMNVLWLVSHVAEPSLWLISLELDQLICPAHAREPELGLTYQLQPTDLQAV
jgi:hypothetical protein